jgi:hypothetical protein
MLLRTGAAISAVRRGFYADRAGQVKKKVRRGRLDSREAVKMAGKSRKAALTHRIRTAAGRALAACPEERWPILEGRIEDVHRLCDEGELEHAVVMLMTFLCQAPIGAGELLDDLHDFAKRLSLGPAGQQMLAQLTQQGRGVRESSPGARERRLRDHGAEVEHSGCSYNLGDLRVIEDCGYSEGGDWLRYLVIRAYPQTATPEEIRADPRYDINSGRLPLVRHPDGVMRPVKTDGRVYLFVGDELRNLRVDMNERHDPFGLRRAGSLEGMWVYLQQFRAPDVE